MSYKIALGKGVEDDIELLKKHNLKEKFDSLLKIMELNPYKFPPSCEKLKRDLKGGYSRRITIKHRLVYKVHKNEKIVEIIKAWGHYYE